MLKQITDYKEVKRVWKDIEKAMKRDSIRSWKHLGSKAGSFEQNIIIRKDLRIWTVPIHEPIHAIWSPWGVLPLKSTGNLNMTVQINIATDPKGERASGKLATDSAGDRWICHTGRVGGGREV